MRILFICKKNENYGFTTYTRRSSGLFNSTRFIVEGLLRRGVHADIIEVMDNNDIDREVRTYKPDIVVIEALWVVPEKFPILRRLHPTVKWFVHMHSGLPFLALEGIAMDWLTRYPEVGVGIIANSRETEEAFKSILPDRVVHYLQNVYIPRLRPPIAFRTNKRSIDIGCFGAVRPMKNQLAQAIAAMEFANRQGKRLRFHINASRVELGGAPVLKNLVQLFDYFDDHELVMHPWMEHDDFLHLLHNEIELGMQVSLTETFNVVTADYVTAGIPIVISKEVKWASSFNVAEDDSTTDMVSIMTRVWRSSVLIRWNQGLLQANSDEAQDQWFKWVRKMTA